MLIFDIESNGLLDKVTKIHCLEGYDTDTSEFCSFNPATVKAGVGSLPTYDSICGHNIISYDIPAIKKVFPCINLNKVKVFDTLIASHLAFPDVHKEDARGRYYIPTDLVGKYSLEAFGYRLGIYKGDYGKQEDCWETWSEEMQNYCKQDVKVTIALYEEIMRRGISKKALDIEQAFQQVINKQEAHGILIDKDAMGQNIGILSPKKIELEAALQEIFPPRLENLGEVTPKANSYIRGTRKDCTFSKIEIVPFNPNSDAHVRRELLALGWIPTRWTDGGKDKDPSKKLPKVAEEDIEHFSHPSVKVLLEYKKVTNCLTKIFDGDASWFNNIQEDGRVHGRVLPFGTGTRRCSHSPNVTQLAKNDYFKGTSLEGKITPRDMCIPSIGMVQVGIDASSLELCCLANYLDDEDYTTTITKGDKNKGTDIHSLNMKALTGYLDNRDDAKTFIYAFNYGAGNGKLGAILGGDAELGKKARTQFLERNPKLDEFIDNVKRAAKFRGHLITIDGAKLCIPKDKDYVAVNYLLQNCGAVIMKVAYAQSYRNFIARGWIWGEDYAITMFNHDELQVECRPEIADEIGKEVVRAITQAGEYLKLKCPLTGEAHKGSSWAETH